MTAFTHSSVGANKGIPERLIGENGTQKITAVFTLFLITQKLNTVNFFMTDFTGRKQFAKNLAITWIAHLFVVMAGFIVPRQMSDSLGQNALGIWDLGWVAVNYLTLTGFGVGPALSREVAYLRSTGNIEKLRKTASTVQMMLTVVAIAIALFAVFISEPVARMVLKDDIHSVAEASTVLTLLILSLAIKIMAMPSGGILAGCHRWDLQNGLNGIHDFLLAAALLACLWLGYDLVILAYIVFIAAIFVSIARVFLGQIQIPEVKLISGGWSTPIANKMLRFGGKTLLIQIPSIVTFQTSALFLAGALGPAALAVLNRSVALTRHIEQAIQKVAAMFSPMTSGSIGLDEQTDHYTLLVRGARDCMLIALPAAIGLGFVGDLLVLIWMGPEYSDHMLVMILAVGSVLPFTQVGTAQVLVGLDAHGRMAKWTIITTTITIIICVSAAFMIGWSVLVAASVIAITRTVGSGIAVQVYVARTCNVSWWRFFIDTLQFPLLLNVPLLIFISLGRLCFDYGDWHIALLLVALGFACTLGLYFLKVIPQPLKDKLFEALPFRKQKQG